MTEEKSIPIIDLELLKISITSKSPPAEALKSIGANLVEAFSDIGFAYVINHGVPDEVVDGAFKVTKEFFDLPQDKKDTVAKPGLGKQGYNAVNRERLHTDTSRYELRESYDINRKDGIHPDSVCPQFRPAMMTLADNLIPLVLRLLKALGHGLGLSNTDKLVEAHTDMLSSVNSTALRVLHYPPIPVEAPADTVRCGAHTDYGTLTVLLQDSIGGLQVKDRNDKWVPAKPIPGALLLNVGDLLQRWTNDKLIATIHNVIVPEEERVRRCSRHSIVFFVHPHHQTIVSSLDDNSPSKYEPVAAKNYVLKRFAETYEY